MDQRPLDLDKSELWRAPNRSRYHNLIDNNIIIAPQTHLESESSEGLHPCPLHSAIMARKNTSDALPARPRFRLTNTRAFPYLLYDSRSPLRISVSARRGFDSPPLKSSLSSSLSTCLRLSSVFLSMPRDMLTVDRFATLAPTYILLDASAPFEKGCCDMDALSCS